MTIDNVVCFDQFSNCVYDEIWGPVLFFLVGYHCFDEFIGPWAALFFVSYSNFQKIKIVIMRNISDV